MKKLFFLLVMMITYLGVFSQDKRDEMLYHQGIEQMENMNWDSAKSLFTQTIQLNPNYIAAFANRGLAFYQLEQFDKATKDFDSIIQITKYKYHWAMYIGTMLFDRKDYNRAFSYFNKASEIARDSSESYFKMGRSLWLKRVKILVANKVEDYAQDTALKSHLKNEIMSYYNKAIYLDSIKNYQLYVTRSSTDAMQDMHSNYEYYYDRAIFEADFAEYSNALADYEMSIQIHPTIDAYQYAAYIARKLGQNEKACGYIQTWATMFNPSEKIDVFKKHQIADEFCNKIGQKFDKNTPLSFSPLSQDKSNNKK